jgi:predicted enzyme related to lactoylglutathione lyase
MKVTVSIDVPSIEAGLAFFGAVFGFAETGRPHPGYAVLTAGEATLDKALAAGAQSEQIHRVPGYPPVAFCSDPFGHGFCIVGLKP